MAEPHEHELARKLAEELIENHRGRFQPIGDTASLREAVAAAFVRILDDEREGWESGVARLLLHAPPDCGPHMNLAKIGERIAEVSRREGVLAGRAEAFAACWAEIKANDAISAIGLHDIEVALVARSVPQAGRPVNICARCGGLGRVHEGARHRQGDCRDVDQCSAWKPCPCTDTSGGA